MTRFARWIALSSLFLYLSCPIVPARAQSGAKNGEWRTYGGDLASTRYAPLDQINADNFNKLTVAWRFNTSSLGPRPEFKFESTPLMVNGVLYSTGGTRRAVVALDAATGELLWMHSENEGARAANAPRQLSGHGLAYWTDGKEERILYVTPGYRLIALNAKTGVPIPSFGVDGVVDLKKDDDQDIDLITGEVGLHSTPVVARNVVIVGAAHLTGGVPKSRKNVKGYVRGFDVRTGKRLWIFHTIPLPNEYGNDTWLKESWAYTGNTGVWGQISVDENLGLVYLPVELPTGDYYGGDRPGNGLFGESLVAIDLETGKRKWHYQLVHHGLWDMDIPCAPILADITIERPNGESRRAADQAGLPVRLQSRNRRADLADCREARSAGRRSRRMVLSDAAISDQAARIRQSGRLRGQPDQLHARVARRSNGARLEIQHRAALHSAVSEQGGRAARHPSFRRERWAERTGPAAPTTPIRTSCTSTRAAISAALGLVPTPGPTVSDMEYVQGTAGFAPRAGRPMGAPPPAPNPESGEPVLLVRGLPLLKPPYGRITAIDLDKGEIVWQVAHGQTPDNVRNNPALAGLDIPRTGSASLIGTLTTKSLVIAGEGVNVTMPDGKKGAMLRAYDKATGKDAGAVYMPAPQTGSPMTYMLNGQQYVVVAISGPGFPGELIAYRLPSN